MLTTATLAELPIPLSAVVKIGADKIEQLWTIRNDAQQRATAEAETDLKAARLAFNEEKERINVTFSGNALDYRHALARLNFERSQSDTFARLANACDWADRNFLLAVIVELSPS